MQSVEVTIKGTVGEPMVLVFAASDTPETVSERLRMLTWIVRQVDGHGAEPRRRATRADRAVPPGSETQS
jgi:hypothetical protein